MQTSNQNTATVPTATNLTFVEVTNSPQGIGTAAAAGAVGLRVYWARRGATAPGTVTVPDSGNHTVAQIAAYRDCETAGNPWDVTGGITNTAATATTLPSITTTVNECRIVFVVGNSLDGALNAMYSPIQYFTGTHNTTEDTYRNADGDGSNTATGTGGGVQSFDGLLAAAVSSGTAAKLNLTNTCQTAILAIALKPPAPEAIVPVQPNFANKPTNFYALGGM